MPKVSSTHPYARMVKETAILRNLIHATHNIQQHAFEGEDGADAILDNAESSIFALAEDRVRAGLIPVKDIVRDNFERLEKIFREGKSITGIPTGYTEMDKLTSGLQPSELLILAARPSQGESGLGVSQAHHGGGTLWEAPGRSVQHLAGIEGPRKGTADSRAGAQPAYACAGARRTRAAAFGFARVGRHRTGCRRGDVHLPAAFLQAGRDARGEGRDGVEDRQAARRPGGQREVCFSEQVFAS